MFPSHDVSQPRCFPVTIRRLGNMGNCFPVTISKQPEEKMKIAIDISPLKVGNYLQHTVRGVGFYLTNLQKALEEYHPEHSYQYFVRGDKIDDDTDVIHYPYFEPFFITLPFQKIKKTVVTVHDLTPLVFPSLFPSGIKGKAKWVIQKKLLQRMDGVITDSHASEKDIVTLAKIPKELVHVIYLAAGNEFKQVKDQKKLQEIVQKYKLPEKFVLYVGDATPNKNLPSLIQACINTKIPLVLVGKALADTRIDKHNVWNRDLIQAQRLISEHDTCIRLGFISNEELICLYNLATVFVLPSLYEGFGLPILEAMACGCPVVTTRNGSIPEVAGEAALYVPADVASLSKGIHSVFTDTKRANALSQQGILQAKKFSWRATADATVKTYEKVMSQ